MTTYKKVRGKCPQCGNSFKGHPNKKFCGQRCKDRYHNTHNPRGYGLGRDDWEQYSETVHPFSDEAFKG